MADDRREIVEAEVVMPCDPLEPTLAFFVEQLGFRIDSIFPADAPRVAVVSGHGVRLRLEPGGGAPPGVLRLRCSDSKPAVDQVAPNGTRILFVPADSPVEVPDWAPTLVLTRQSDDSQWVNGRAGMQYRDLVPDRQGGHVIASHIRIAEGGPVPDYVHYHRVRFQMIYCKTGEVRVVYEDQGPPFVLRAGDCVLQPPQIRHRVLECSPGLEVIEVGCPAEHETHADHDLPLPNEVLRPERSFDGQRFVRHQAAMASWMPWHIDGFECQDLGITAATDGLASVHVARRSSADPDPTLRSHAREFLLLVVLSGQANLHFEGRDPESLADGDSVVIPAGIPHALRNPTSDLELLEVTL